MTEYKILISRAFKRDVDKIQVFLLANEATELTVRKVLNGLYESMTNLRISPLIGAKLSTKTTIPNDYRYLLSGKYLIFYKVFDREKVVRIYHVYHGKENYLVKLNF